MHLRLAQLSLIAALCGITGRALALPPTMVTCGDTIAAQRNAHLIGDCSGSIRIASGRLFLDGHTITGTGLAAIECEGGCRVDGPGIIASGGSTFGISGDDRIRITSVTISGHETAGINSGQVGGIRIADSVITHNGVGVRGTRIHVRNSTISDNRGSGIIATTRGVNMKGCTVEHNGEDGIATILTDDFGNVVKVSSSNVRFNGNFGIVAKNVSAKGVIVRSNSQDGNCDGQYPCADLAAVRRPHLSLVACSTSLQIPEELSGPIPFGPSWSVCDSDPTP